MQKKAIALSINFIVILIIAIVIFSFGIFFVNKVFNITTEKHKEITEMTKTHIEGMLDSGEKVAIPVTTLKLRRGDSGVFGMGVLNIDTVNVGTIANEFYIKIEPGDVFKEDGSPITPPSGLFPEIAIRSGNPYIIETNKKEVYSVVVKVPSNAIAGTYILNVYVCHDNEPINTVGDSECIFATAPGTELYDNSIHQIYVEVS